MELTFLEQLLHDISGFLRESFGGRYQVRLKQDQTLVTDVDLESDRRIREAIGRKFPDDDVMTEEQHFLSAREKGKGVWIVDPLDGTNNFAHGYPFFCVSIAHGRFDAYGRIEVEHAGVANPLSGEVFLAQRGKGSNLGGEPLGVRRKNLGGQLFCAISDHEAEDADLLCGGMSMRKDGAVALDLALVAQGTFDGFWGRDLKPWDIAAGALLIEEAGGVVKSFQVDQDFHIECQGLICGSAHVVEHIQKTLKLDLLCANA